jgi:hypothetical protein
MWLNPAGRSKGHTRPRAARPRAAHLPDAARFWRNGDQVISRAFFALQIPLPIGFGICRAAMLLAAEWRPPRTADHYFMLEAI